MCMQNTQIKVLTSICTRCCYRPRLLLLEQAVRKRISHVTGACSHYLAGYLPAHWLTALTVLSVYVWRPRIALYIAPAKCWYMVKSVEKLTLMHSISYQEIMVYVYWAEEFGIWKSYNFQQVLPLSPPNLYAFACISYWHVFELLQQWLFYELDSKGRCASNIHYGEEHGQDERICVGIGVMT